MILRTIDHPHSLANHFRIPSNGSMSNPSTTAETNEIEFCVIQCRIASATNWRPEESPFMNRILTRPTARKGAACIAIFMLLDVILAIAPDAFAWGLGTFNGGFGGESYGGGGFNQGGAYGGGGGGFPSGGASQMYIYPSRG
jgi:hypothetical protein